MSDTLPPGPWSAELNQHSDTWLVYGPHSAEPFVEVETYCNPRISEDALMRLWAAAPDLLAALTEALPYLIDNLDERDEEWRVVETAVRAVSHATGQEVTP